MITIFCCYEDLIEMLFLETQCYLMEKDYSGNQIGFVSGILSAIHCQLECIKNPKCEYFGYNVSSLTCYLKGSLVTGLLNDSRIIAGPRTCFTKGNNLTYTYYQSSHILK